MIARNMFQFINRVFLIQFVLSELCSSFENWNLMVFKNHIFFIRFWKNSHHLFSVCKLSVITIYHKSASCCMYTIWHLIFESWAMQTYIVSEVILVFWCARCPTKNYIMNLGCLSKKIGMGICVANKNNTSMFYTPPGLACTIKHATFFPSRFNNFHAIIVSTKWRYIVKWKL